MQFLQVAGGVIVPRPCITLKRRKKNLIIILFRIPNLKINFVQNCRQSAYLCVGLTRRKYCHHIAIPGNKSIDLPFGKNSKSSGCTPLLTLGCFGSKSIKADSNAHDEIKK
jgi:hypothetical protein